MVVPYLIDHVYLANIMKIVKSFYDDQYYDLLCKHLGIPNDNQGWEWGLGEDGKLYCFCETFHQTMMWQDFIEVAGKNFILPVSCMRKIVKQFGDLLVFL